MLLFCLQIPGIVRFFGRGGMTIDSYDETLFQQMLRFRPDVILINLAGNDIDSRSVPKDIANKVVSLIETLKNSGTKAVYFVEICERGLFRKDPKLTKKCFNAQRRKINKLINSTDGVRFVELKMRFPKDYDNDKVHFSQYKGMEKFMYTVRRILMSHKCV